MKSYIILSKSPQFYLIYFTGLGAMAIGGSIYGYDRVESILLSIATILGAKGLNPMINFLGRRTGQPGFFSSLQAHALHLYSYFA